MPFCRLRSPYTQFLRILAICAAVIVCCASLSTAKDTIRFLAAQYSSATEPYWLEVKAAFEKENPDIEVKVEVCPWASLHDKITTLIGAKQHPDLVNIGTSWLPEYVKAGVALPIDDRLTSDLRGRFVESLLQGAAMNGKMYGLPIATSVRAMYYNKDMFAAAKLEPPKTWEELRAAAKTLTKPGKTYGFLMPVNDADQGDQFDYFLWAAGGDWFDTAGNVALNSPESVEALQFMKELYKDKLTNPEPWVKTRDDTSKMFVNGRAAMIETGPFLMTQIEKDNPKLNYGVAEIPHHKTGGSLGITDTLAFFKRDDQKTEAVWKFVAFMYKDNYRREFTQKENMLPELKTITAELKSDPKWGKFVELLPTAKFQPNHEFFMPISKRLVKAIQLALLEQKTPKQALDEAVEDINKNILHK